VFDAANLPQEALEQLPAQFEAGIYFGWASIDGAGPYKMVASVGWNPFYDNKTRTVEPHLLHEFARDFYGAEIRLVMTGMCALVAPRVYPCVCARALVRCQTVLSPRCNQRV